MHREHDFLLGTTSYSMLNLKCVITRFWSLMAAPNAATTPAVESNLAAVSLSSDELAAKALDEI